MQAYQSKEAVLEKAETALNKSLLDFVPPQGLQDLKTLIASYGSNRRGHFGDLVERYVFGIENNGRPEPDFLDAGVELKTTPLKRHSEKKYVAKERLVFSMIDYAEVIKEEWESSTFLKKNKMLLIMFYLFEEGKDILEYEFKFVKLLDLLHGLSAQDVEQIKNDWIFIVEKIKRGEAHLLSEGDTFYLGACTKAKNSLVVRDQPASSIKAKPRAFSLKQTYLNSVIQSQLIGEDQIDSIFHSVQKVETVDQIVAEKLRPYIGMSVTQIIDAFGWEIEKGAKGLRRQVINRLLTGSGSNRIAELDKANITLRVVALEPSGVLKESISFPAFDYNELIQETWYDEESGAMAEFHEQLETKKFLFVVFQKMKDSEEVILTDSFFWNFPQSDMPEAERVWQETVNRIRAGEYEELPRISESSVVHVRPHGADSDDVTATPDGGEAMKKCFWLNAKYIEKVIQDHKNG